MQTEHAPLRPTYLKVNLTRLSENLRAIQTKVQPARVMPVVKANAYGHGLVPVARYLLSHGADALAVAILDEALALRQAGIRADILVMGGILPEQIEAYLLHNILLTVTSLENVHQIAQSARSLGVTARLHVKVDTGMGRLGVSYDQADQLLASVLEQPCLRLEGIFSHFANADAADLHHARAQLARFEKTLEFFSRSGLPRPITHIANSGGILQLPESYYDLVRPGIMLYGFYPSKEAQRSVAVRPALTWVTRPVLCKVLPAHHPVSYGSTWQSDHPVNLLTLPVGYGDGYFRALSNRAQVLVRGERRPLVGRVCMDQVMINLEGESARSDDEVVLLGEQGDASISADELADLVGTIPYEILTNITARVPRVYVEE